MNASVVAAIASGRTLFGDIGLSESDIECLAFYHAVYGFHPGIVAAGKLLPHVLEHPIVGKGIPVLI